MQNTHINKTLGNKITVLWVLFFSLVSKKIRMRFQYVVGWELGKQKYRDS